MRYQLRRSVVNRSSAGWLDRKWPRRICLAITLGTAALSLTVQRNLTQAQPQKVHRVDIPFTRSIVTPHIVWVIRSAGPPLHAFVVPGVTSGRTLIELPERIPLAFRTVMIDENWSPNTYIGFDRDYEARTYPVVYKYLTEDLTVRTDYDVLVIPSLLGWNRLPTAAREAIRKRVEQGEGLVLIHPTTGIPPPGEPQVPLPTNRLANPGKLWPGKGPWKVVASSFITASLPLEAFPYNYLRHYKYRLGKDSTTLLVGEQGEPIVAVNQYGKG